MFATKTFVHHPPSRKGSVVCLATNEKPIPNNNNNNNKNGINEARKKFEKERNVTLKENLNKVLAIGNNEVKEVGGFLKELDELHKKQLKDVFGSWGKKGSSSSPISIKAAEEDARDDNIFADK